MAKTPAMLLLLILLVCQLSGMKLTHFAIKQCDDKKRPVVCPKIWAPVCAKFKDGKKQKMGSPCGACQDVNVVEYDESGKC